VRDYKKKHANPKPNTLWSGLLVMKRGQILVTVIVIMQLPRTGFIYTAQIKLHTGDFVICDRMNSTQSYSNCLIGLLVTDFE
jgi:hypothetical protein